MQARWYYVIQAEGNLELISNNMTAHLPSSVFPAKKNQGRYSCLNKRKFSIFKTKDPENHTLSSGTSPFQLYTRGTTPRLYILLRHFKQKKSVFFSQEFVSQLISILSTEIIKYQNVSLLPKQYLPSPQKPALQVQLYDPTLLRHIALTSQLWCLIAHTSIAKKQKVCWLVFFLSYLT